MNVRWDAVAKSGSFEALNPVRDSADASFGCAGPEALTVRVWLFGPLAERLRCGPIVLEVAAPCRLRDLLERLETRFAPGLLRRVVDSRGRARETCRISVNGALARDLSATIPADRDATTVELILFQEIEGG